MNKSDIDKTGEVYSQELNIFNTSEILRCGTARWGKFQGNFSPPVLMRHGLPARTAGQEVNISTVLTSQDANRQYWSGRRPLGPQSRLKFPSLWLPYTYTAKSQAAPAHHVDCHVPLGQPHFICNYSVRLRMTAHLVTVTGRHIAPCCGWQEIWPRHVGWSHWFCALLCMCGWIQ
jgi:hypothetical protein